jgi:hypothetical protein
MECNGKLRYNGCFLRIELQVFATQIPVVELLCCALCLTKVVWIIELCW